MPAPGCWAAFWRVFAISTRTASAIRSESSCVNRACGTADGALSARVAGLGVAGTGSMIRRPRVSASPTTTARIPTTAPMSASRLPARCVVACAVVSPLRGAIGTVRGDDVDAGAPVGVVIASNSARAAAADAGRSSGCLASSRITSDANDGGTPGQASSSGVGMRVSCAAIVACGELPLNGCTPVSSSYASSPTA